MTSTFVNDLRLNEMATGDQSGSWGTVTNTNLELIGEALGYGTEGITTNANTHTSTIADGATDPVRALYVEYTGTLDSACTVTIAPNTVNKVCFIENGTSGSQNIIIKQGSGATITIPPGDTKAVYLDGAGSGAKVVDAFASLSVVDLNVSGTALVTGVLTTTAPAVFNGGFTSNGDTATFASGNADDPIIIIKNTRNDAASAGLQFVKDKGAAGADGDDIGQIDFIADNDAQQQTTFVSILSEVSTAADGSEGGKYAVRLATHDGEMQTGLLLQDGNAEDEIDVTIGSGTSSVTTIAGTLTTTGNVTIANGSSSAPAIAFASDTDTGILRGGTNNLAFAAGGVTRTYIDANTHLATNTAGTSNLALGVNAGNSIASGGNFNVCVGDEAGTAITTGDGMVAIGYQSLMTEDTQGHSTAVGAKALKIQNSGGTSYNVAVGSEAGTAVTTGVNNTILGAIAGTTTSTASNQVLIGTAAGALVTGDKNTFCGTNSGDNMTTGAKNAIFGRYNGNQGSLDIRTSSNNIVLSDGDGNPRMLIGSTGAATLGGATYDSTKTLKLQNVDQNNAASYAIHSIGRQSGSSGRVQIWTLSGTSNSGAYFVYAENEAANVFNIRGTGNVQNANNSYGSTSDVKLKENIQDASSQWDDIKSLQVRKYSFISENLDAPNQLGVIAQELESSGMSGLVETNADIDPHTGEDFGTTTKTVKYSILYMKAVKALQEAMDRIETLETKVTALEGA